MATTYSSASLEAFDDLYVVSTKCKVRHVALHPSRPWIAFTDENDDLFLHEYAGQCRSMDPNDAFFVPAQTQNNMSSASSLQLPHSADFTSPFSFAQHSLLSQLDGKEVSAVQLTGIPTKESTAKILLGRIRQISFHGSLSRLVVLHDFRLVVYDLSFPSNLEPVSSISGNASHVITQYASAMRRREIPLETTKPLTCIVLLPSRPSLVAVGGADGVIRMVDCETGALIGMRIPPNTPALDPSSSMHSGLSVVASAASLPSSSSTLKVSHSLSSVNLSATHAAGSSASSGSMIGGAGVYAGVVRLSLSSSESTLFASYADGSLVTFEIKDEDDEDDLRLSTAEDVAFEHEDDRGSSIPAMVIARAMSGPSPMTASAAAQQPPAPPAVLIAFHAPSRYVFLTGGAAECNTLIARDSSRNMQFVWKYSLPPAKGPIVAMSLYLSFVLIVGKSASLILLDTASGQVMWESEALLPVHQTKPKKKGKCYGATARADGTIALAGSTGCVVVSVPWPSTLAMFGGLPSLGRHGRQLFYVVGSSVYSREVTMVPVTVDEREKEMVALSKPTQTCRFTPEPLPRAGGDVTAIPVTRWMSTGASSLWHASCPLRSLSPLTRTLLHTIETQTRAVSISPSRRFVAIGARVFDIEKGTLVFAAANTANPCTAAWMHTLDRDSFAVVIDLNLSSVGASSDKEKKEKDKKKDKKSKDAGAQETDSVQRRIVIYNIERSAKDGSVQATEVARVDRLQDYSVIALYSGPLLCAYTQRGDLVMVSWTTGQIVEHLPMFSRAPPRGVFWAPKRRLAIALDQRIYLVHGTPKTPVGTIHANALDCLWVGDSLLFYITMNDVRVHGFVPASIGGPDQDFEFDMSLLDYEKQRVLLSHSVPLATQPLEYSAVHSQSLSGIPLGTPLRFASSLVHDTLLVADLGLRMYPLRIRDPELKMRIAMALEGEGGQYAGNYKMWEPFVTSR